MCCLLDQRFTWENTKCSHFLISANQFEPAILCSTHVSFKVTDKRMTTTHSVENLSFLVIRDDSSVLCNTTFDGISEGQWPKYWLNIWTEIGQLFHLLLNTGERSYNLVNSASLTYHLSQNLCEIRYPGCYL